MGFCADWHSADTGFFINKKDKREKQKQRLWQLQWLQCGQLCQ